MAAFATLVVAVITLMPGGAEAGAQPSGITNLDCPLRMTFVASNSGRIGPSTFPVAGFVITAVGDRIEGFSATNHFPRFIPTDSSVAVEGVGRVEVGTPPMTVVNEDGFVSFVTEDGKTLVNGPFIGNWDMISPFSTTGVGSMEGWSSVDVLATTGQRVVFDDRLGMEMDFNAVPECPTPTATSTPTPTPTATATPFVLEVPPPTPIPTATSTPTPRPIITPTIPTIMPSATPTPQPTSSQTQPVPQPTTEPRVPTATPDVQPPGVPDPGHPTVESPNEEGVFIDPYECGPDGGSFLGKVNIGTPPYLISYEVSLGADRTLLPPFPVANEGDYRSPAGYVGRASLSPGRYSVSALATDALGASARFSFGATITPTCPGEVLSGTANAAPAPVAGAPLASPPLTASSLEISSTESPATAPELAFTGRGGLFGMDLGLWGLLAIGLGAMLLASKSAWAGDHADS